MEESLNGVFVPDGYQVSEEQKKIIEEHMAFHGLFMIINDEVHAVTSIECVKITRTRLKKNHNGRG